MALRPKIAPSIGYTVTTALTVVPLPTRLIARAESRRQILSLIHQPKDWAMRLALPLLTRRDCGGRPISDLADRLSELQVHAADHLLVDTVPDPLPSTHFADGRIGRE